VLMFARAPKDSSVSLRREDTLQTTAPLGSARAGPKLPSGNGDDEIRVPAATIKRAQNRRVWSKVSAQECDFFKNPTNEPVKLLKTMKSILVSRHLAENKSVNCINPSTH